MEMLEVIKSINNLFEITFPDTFSYTQFRGYLIQRINHLIINDFDRLIAILYKMDINEDKLKKILKQNANNDAAPIIANLLIEREEQKIKSRQHFNNSNNLSNEEMW